jgi:hypothetical protein
MTTSRGAVQACSADGADMTEEELQLRNQRVSTLTKVVSEAVDGAQHSEVLEALLVLYIAMAIAHPCCSESAQHALGLAAARIHVARTANVGNIPALTHGAPSSIQ